MNDEYRLNDRTEEIAEATADLQEQLKNREALIKIQEALIDNLSDVIKVKDDYILKLKELI